MRDARNFHGISFEDEKVTSKIDAQASTPTFHAQRVMSLQSLEQGEVVWNLLWPVISFKPHHCDQYLCHQNANADFPTPLVPLHKTFHLRPNK